MSCRKHEPVPLEGGNIIDQLAGRVQCGHCGMKGRYSNGSRKIGRPRRVIWYHRAALSEQEPKP